MEGRATYVLHVSLPSCRFAKWSSLGESANVTLREVSPWRDPASSDVIQYTNSFGARACWKPARIWVRWQRRRRGCRKGAGSEVSSKGRRRGSIYRLIGALWIATKASVSSTSFLVLSLISWPSFWLVEQLPYGPWYCATAMWSDSQWTHWPHGTAEEGAGCVRLWGRSVWKEEAVARDKL